MLRRVPVGVRSTFYRGARRSSELYEPGFVAGGLGTTPRLFVERRIEPCKEAVVFDHRLGPRVARQLVAHQHLVPASKDVASVRANLGSIERLVVDVVVVA